MKTRMSRVFNTDGNTFILAMDHGASMDIHPYLNNPEKIIKEGKANGVDAFITTYGMAKEYGSAFGQSGVIVRADGGTSQMGAPSFSKKMISTEDIIKLGADGAVTMGFPGADQEVQSLAGNLMSLIREADEWNMLLCAEMLPYGWDGKTWTTESLSFACRIASEYGADFIKTQYTGDKESFKALVDACYQPVIILGGPGDGSERALLNNIKESLEAGGKGVAIGRSIWKHKNPGSYCRAIAKIVHEGASVESALKELE